MRAVRRRRQPDRQRAAHAGPPRLDERVDQDRDRAERRRDAARRRLRAERSVPRRHAPARRHRRHAGVPAKTRASCRRSTSARAATTPTSAAPRRARCRRSRPASRRRACSSTTSSWSRAAASCEDETRGAARERPVAVAQPGAEHRRPARRRSPPTRRARASSRAMVDQYGLDVVQQLHAARAGQRRGVGAPRHHAAQGRRVHAAARQRRADQRRHPRRRGKRAAPRSTSPAPRAQLDNNFNAPTAVCMAAVLYVFRTLVDDEIPLNAGCLKPITVIIPEGSMLNPRAAGVGRRRQRRDVDVHHQRALRRARRDGVGAVHDEQLHLRQRAPPVLRDDRRRLGRRARLRRRGAGRSAASTAPRSCRRT